MPFKVDGLPGKRIDAELEKGEHAKRTTDIAAILHDSVRMPTRLRISLFVGNGLILRPCIVGGASVLMPEGRRSHCQQNHDNNGRKRYPVTLHGAPFFPRDPTDWGP